MAEKVKLHVGLIAPDKAWDNTIKEVLTQMGGGYVHSAKAMLELYNKMGMQKIDLLFYVSPPGETGAEAQAVVNFFRGKREYAQMPIGIFVDGPRVEMRRLLKDTRTRGFTALGGAFLPMMTLQPLLSTTAAAEVVEPLSLQWIENEFMLSLQNKIGQQTQFELRPANDDDLHRSFFCQHADEIRSHLGWFKFSARLQEGSAEGMAQLFRGLDSDMMETMAQGLLTAIVNDFKEKAENDLHGRGAIFYPPIEELPANERKIVYGGSKPSAWVFTSEACNVVLEVIQYI